MSLRWKLGSVVLLLVLFGWLAGANFFTKEARIESPLLPDDGLRWGLDLQGGIHWVVGVEMSEAIDRELGFIRTSLVEDLEKKGVPATSIRVESERLIIDNAAGNLDAAKALVGEEYTVLRDAGSAANELSYELVTGRVDEVQELTMRQVLEVLRKRIDDPIQGIPDSVVTRQGVDRVLVQIPGEQIDRKPRPRTCCDSTGFLEFKIVARLRRLEGEPARAARSGRGSRTRRSRGRRATSRPPDVEFYLNAQTR